MHSVVLVDIMFDGVMPGRVVLGGVVL